jgi:hypothetical protein
MGGLIVRAVEAAADRVVAAVLGEAGRSDLGLRTSALERAEAITCGGPVLAASGDALLALGYG